MKTNQKGFSVIEGLLVLVIIGAIGLVGWYVWQAKIKTNTSLDKAASANLTVSTKKTEPKKVQPAADTYAGWQACVDKYEGMTFRYPVAWTSSAGDQSPCGSSTRIAAGNYVDIKSPVSSAPYFRLRYSGDVSAKFDNSGDPLTIKQITPLDLQGVTTPFYLVAYVDTCCGFTDNGEGKISGIALSNRRYTVGQVVHTTPYVVSKGRAGEAYFMDVVLTAGHQYLENYPQSQYQKHPEYANLIKVLQSVSY